MATAGDTLDEEDETFTVRLSNQSSNATLAADPTAQGTITDDDDEPTLSVNEPSATEGSPLVFKVTLMPESGKQVTVDWAATGDSATAGTDFTAANGALTFTAGVTTATFTVATIDDDSEEDEETVTVTLSNESNATLPDPATATGTITDANAAPSFTSSASHHVAENTTAVVTVTATDDDDDITGYEITGGADQALFEIGAITGVLTFKSAPNYEDPKDSGTDNDYVVEVQATSGEGEREKTATQTITVTVTNVDPEVPGKPVAPAVAAASATSLTVNWSAPSNVGPAITDYDVQYRAGTSGDWSDGGHAGTATTATLTGLSENTSYQVQVRATNAEGMGAWSDSGSGTTDADLPVVTIAADANVTTEEQDAEFTLSRTGLTAAALTVAVAVRQQAERDLLPDGAAANRTVTFAADAATAALTVELEKDTLRELPGDLTVEVQEVQAGAGYTVGDPSRAVVPVRDADQGAPLTPQGLTAEAGARAGAVVLAWTAPAPHLVYDRHEYRYKTDGAYGSWRSIPNSGRTPTVEGTNLAGYTVTGLAGGQEHTFQVRARISYGNPSVNVYSDASNEATATPPVPTVTLHLSDIFDNAVGNGEVLENVGTITVTATVTPASATAFTVTVTASPVAPATSDDYTLSAGTVLSFAANATESTGTVTIHVVDEEDPEPPDVVTVSGAVSDAAVTAPDDVTLTIVNDDFNVRYEVAVEAPADGGRGRGDGGGDGDADDAGERGPGGRDAGALFRAAGADGGGRRRLHLAGDGGTHARDHRGGVGFLAECRRDGLGDGGQLHDRHRRRRPG